jgi:flagellar FliJ protein
MKNLDKLIRVHQWRLNEKRRKVEELENLTARLKAEIEQIEASLRSEQQKAAYDTKIATGYGICASAVIARREKLIQSLTGLENEMLQATNEVSAASREFERFDRMRTRNQEKAQREMKRLQAVRVGQSGFKRLSARDHELV